MSTLPERDGWRIGWSVDGKIMSALRGRATEGQSLTHQLMRILPLEAHHGPIFRAECHPRSEEVRVARAPAGHTAPHPDCYCGIHACDRLEHLQHLAEAMVGPLAVIERAMLRTSGGIEPPGIVLYRVLLHGAIESALYKHGKARGRGFRGDPPGTWRAARAEVIGPIFTTRAADVGAIRLNYTQWMSPEIASPRVYHRDTDPVRLVERLRALEPPSNAHPCPECRYTTHHATACGQFSPWWDSRVTADLA